MESEGMRDADPMKPLIVDLDGTLIRSDMTHELFVLCLRWAPHMLFYAAYLLLTDRPRAKRWMTERFGHHIDPAFLPYEAAATGMIERHRDGGGEVWLVSGSDHELVGRIAEHVGLFSRFEGTRPGTNLTSGNKAAFLTETLPDGFLYAGNSSQDIAVWQKSYGGFAFSAPRAAFDVKTPEGEPVQLDEVVPKSGKLQPLRRAMRLHQWAKNILIFVVPGLTLAQLTVGHFVELVAGFICFGLMASGTYILNDLFDVQDDRRHATKRMRQIADGRLSVPLALVAIAVFVGGSLAGAFLLQFAFGVVLAIYAAVTIAYSFRLKRIPVLDVFVLAGLFSLRVWAGAEIISSPPSAWLMMFIGLVFLSLALAKRYVEIRKAEAGGKISGRGYVAEDAPMVLAFGAATANASVLSLVIYGLLAPNRLIDNPMTMTVVACIIAAWFMRLWMVAVRGELHDDPVLYAIKDRVSLGCLALVAGFLAAESLRPVWSQWF
jgi:4-hydroxybenzoate polyprenyltransferase